MTDLDNLDRELLTETEGDDELLDSELDTVVLTTPSALTSNPWSS